jgi:hypothetical protein
MYLGIDTHKQAHILMALDEEGRQLGTRPISNTPEGWAGYCQGNWRALRGGGDAILGG